jgi:hypothetical protein
MSAHEYLEELVWQLGGKFERDFATDFARW